MSEQAIIRFGSNKLLAIFLILGGLFFCWPVTLFIPGTFINGYPQVASIIMCTFFSAFALWAFIAAYRLGPLSLGNDRIIKYSLLGNKIKTIMLDEIVSWEESENEKQDQQQIIIIAKKRSSG